MRIDEILLFEQENADDFYPFSIMHPIWEIRCGALRIFEKYQRQFPDAKLHFYGREKHTASFAARFKYSGGELSGGETLVASANLLPDRYLIDLILQSATNRERPDKPLLFRASGKNAAALIPAHFFEDNPALKEPSVAANLDGEAYSDAEFTDLSGVSILRFLWDAIEHNARAILDDARHFSGMMTLKEMKFDGVFGINPERILVGAKTKIAPQVVIDASDGPVIIRNNVNIMPHATIIGPCYIGDGSTIKVGAKIYEATSIGHTCKVGGEIENSIIHAFSNKQHDGFLGHSYIGEWVNLGADTNTSDLKNTYGDIKVMLRDREIDSGRMFLGLLCGDHSKSAINTSFTTGTVAGVAGVLLAEGFLPRAIPSFAWTGRKNSPIYKIEKALEVARKVMSRRGQVLTREEEELMFAEYATVKKN